MIFFVTEVAGASSPKQAGISLQCWTAQGLSQSHPVFHLAGACSFSLCHLRAQAAQNQKEYILLICFTQRKMHFKKKTRFHNSNVMVKQVGVSRSLLSSAAAIPSSPHMHHSLLPHLISDSSDQWKDRSSKKKKRGGGESGWGRVYVTQKISQN